MPRGKYIHKKRPDLILINKSEKQRLAVSRALRGRPSPFKGKKRKPFTEEAKKKLSEAKLKNPTRYWLGKKRPDISERRMGIKFTEEHKKKLSESHKGYVMPEEQKLKISLANKGKQPKFIVAGWNKGKKLPERSGKNCHLWKGGITPLNAKIRSGIEFRLWREAVFARDNWTCQKTGVKGGYLVAHHIQNFSQFPESRFAINNGITLSKQAHYDFHRIYGTKNNTKEQLEEFICHE